MTEPPALTGHDLIQSYLKTIDGSPGVYRMLNAKTEVLYVGKARNLRARVSNYARPSGHSLRIARMIFETTQMMFLTTRTETEALLLEQNLIKQLKPRYNVLLRDDKSFPNILIAKDHPFPQIKKHRGKKTEKGSYFGPFASAGAVTRTLNQLQKVFLLRNCSDSMFEGRTRPCLQFQIKRCSAPCVAKIDGPGYATLVADAFDLDAPPTRIEIYDNAHIQGTNAVGGMVVAGPDGFVKSQYRKFNIKSEAGANSDDFGMMREVLTRRFERLLKEDPDRKSDLWPDLLLIDGGAGQVSAVAGILAELGVDDVAMVGVAKGEDRDAGKEVFHRTGQIPMALQMNDPVLYFIQRLRDEAHRWANGAHVAKRAKAVSITPLDDIPGVGATRKRALLAHFGSAKAVARAGLSDLTAVAGISEAMAQVISDFFAGRG